MVKEGFKIRIILKTLYSIAEEFEEGEDYEEGVHVQEAIQHIAKNTFLKKRKGGLMMKFSLGKTVMTCGVQDSIPQKEIHIALSRHANGDWGDLSKHDRKSNDEALRTGEDRLFSAYHSEKKEKFWIITEWDRSYTTVLLPSEY